ncbi:auxin-responsive protein IAA31-like [Tasmannia lanceolata]|uniref:auxin-responsive protein IAA31-like n=1 Tax=Tasmannia lanceolata TaxID=3420 RepID=UPI0040648040
MELQLGLALPNHGFKGFDLNTPKDMCSGFLSSHGVGNNKRDYEEAFLEGGAVIKTLPLLWKYEEDAPSNCHDNNKTAFVGWPPIKSSRKLQCRRGSIDGEKCTGRKERDINGSNSLYVKVKMEGVAIGRKIDLSLHNSYHSLTRTLNCMFGIYQKTQKEYTLTYQDKDDDWMLVGDVPWGTFMESVRRLKIQRS